MIRVLLTYYLRICLSCSFVLTRFCTLNWVTKILMRAISNVHAGRRFPTLGVIALLQYGNNVYKLILTRKRFRKIIWLRFCCTSRLADIFGKSPEKTSEMFCSYLFRFKVCKHTKLIGRHGFMGTA